MSTQTEVVIAGHKSEALFEHIAQWGPVTTIVLHLGSVFEFKGNFPLGAKAEGFYNLKNSGVGFEGHLNLASIDHIAFQERVHRGRDSYALVFKDQSNECIFKVFLGRRHDGEIFPAQLEAFQLLKTQWAVERQEEL